MKAVVSVAPFLEPRALGHVLRAFATLQRDEEPAIRARRPTALPRSMPPPLRAGLPSVHGVCLVACMASYPPDPASLPPPPHLPLPKPSNHTNPNATNTTIYHS